MKGRLRDVLRSAITLISGRRLVLSWTLYFVGVLLTCVMWYPPMARHISVDTNDLSPGSLSPKITYSYSKFIDFSTWTERTISPQRSDSSQRILIIVIDGDKREDSVVSEVASSLLDLDPIYLSKEVVVLRALNYSMAQVRSAEYARKYAEQTIGAIVLIEDSIATDVQVDVRGPTMARANRDMVASLLVNCDTHGVTCEVISDIFVGSIGQPVHWILNDNGVDSLTLVLKHMDRPSSSVNGIASRRNYERLVQRHCNLVEAQIRCLNNLMEPLHDASFL